MANEVGRSQVDAAIDRLIKDALQRQNTASVIRSVFKMITKNFVNIVDDSDKMGGGGKFGTYRSDFTVGLLTPQTDLSQLGANDVIKLMTSAPFVAATGAVNVAPALIEKGVATDVDITGNININEEDPANITNIRITKADGVWKQGLGATFAFDDSIASTTSYTLLADTPNGQIQASKTISAFAPSFYGSVSSGGVDETQAKGGTKQIWGPQGSRVITFNNNNQRNFFVEPKTNGIRNRIIDQNGFNVTAGFTRSEVVFTLADGTTTEAMYLYLMNEPAGNGSAFVVSFFNS